MGGEQLGRVGNDEICDKVRQGPGEDEQLTLGVGVGVFKFCTLGTSLASP